MEISTYWVGDVPPPLVIDVRDQRGRSINLSVDLTKFEAVLVRGKERIALPESALYAGQAAVGRFTLTWPKKSVFTKRGEYQLQLRMSGPNRVESTTVHTIKVKEVGRD
jgi:hypothetical protein